MGIRIEPHQLSIHYERRVIESASISGDEIITEYGVESVDADYLDFETEDVEEIETSIYVEGVVPREAYDQLRDRMKAQIADKNELIGALENRIKELEEKGDEK